MIDKQNKKYGIGVFAIIILVGLSVVFGLAAKAFGQTDFDKTFTLEKKAYLDSHKRRQLNASMKADSTSLTVKAWGTECEFKINGLKQTPVQIYKRNDDNLEWEIILNSRPTRNYIEYSIETKGLVFHYQDTLMDDDTMSSRPDSVIGSYAVYHDSRRHNLIKRDGTQEIYGTGKAFHIYRPKAWDSGGDTVWCELSVDTKTEMMTVTVPQKFLDNAVYPVIVDPTFGYTSTGGSNTWAPNGLGRGYQAENMGATAGTVDSFYAYIGDDGIKGKVGMALYTASGDSCIDLLDSSTTKIQPATAPAWLVYESAENATVEASTYYWIAAIIDSQSVNKIYYDDLDEDVSAEGWDSWPPNSTCGLNDYEGETFSFYVVYTEASEDATKRRRKMLLGNN